jgi:hypothetical protein
MLGLKLIAGAALLARGVLGEGVHLFNCSPLSGAAWPYPYLSVAVVRERALGLLRLSETKDMLSPCLVLRQ